MKQELPVILGAGIFDSQKKFGKLEKTVPRTVETYELEYFFEDGGMSVLNGKEYPLKKGAVLFSKPADIRYSHLHFKCKFLHFTFTEPKIISYLENIDCFFHVIEAKKIEEAFTSTGTDVILS